MAEIPFKLISPESREQIDHGGVSKRGKGSDRESNYDEQDRGSQTPPGAEAEEPSDQEGLI